MSIKTTMLTMFTKNIYKKIKTDLIMPLLNVVQSGTFWAVEPRTKYLIPKKQVGKKCI